MTPIIVWLDPKVEKMLEDPDALSVSNCTVFRHGGESNGVKAQPYVKLTPELVELLRRQ